MKRLPAVAFLMIVAVEGLVLAGAVHFGTVQASTSVIGLIDLNATWTKANSPYTLAGPIAVSRGVTLTVEPGAIIDLNGYYIQVNGTLQAIGTTADKISFSNGQIRFTSVSDGWNEQNRVGCIIENAVLSTSISCSNSLKLNNNTINAVVYVEGSSIVSNNTVKGDISVLSGSPTIANNVVSGHINTYLGKAAGFMPIILNNVVTDGGIACYGGNGYGGYAYVYSNVVSNCERAIACSDGIVERNFVSNNVVGVVVGNGIVRNNTITNNSKAISIPKIEVYFFGFGEILPKPTIENNNIYENEDYNIYSTTSGNITASYNWWGTVDAQAISEKIYDHKNDFNIGVVTFLPFLPEPNPQATPSATLPTDLPEPSQNSGKIAVSTTSATVLVGTPITITVRVLDATSSVLAEIAVVDPSGNIHPIGPFNTDPSGVYSINWTPTMTGIHTITAAIAQTQSTSRPNATITVTVIQVEPDEPSQSSTPIPSPDQSTNPSSSLSPPFSPANSQSPTSLPEHSGVQSTSQTWLYEIVAVLVIMNIALLVAVAVLLLKRKR